MSQIYPLLYDVLGRVAEDCDSVMAVADARGQLLWVCGRPAVLRRAEEILFVEGAQWDEAHAGTNAPGTALRLDTAVSIRSAEHFVRPVQRVCAAGFATPGSRPAHRSFRLWRSYHSRKPGPPQGGPGFLLLTGVST